MHTFRKSDNIKYLQKKKGETREKMKYFLVFGAMYNKLVMAEDKSNVPGLIIREMTEEQAKEYKNRLEQNITNID